MLGLSINISLLGFLACTLVSSWSFRFLMIPSSACCFECDFPAAFWRERDESTLAADLSATPTHLFHDLRYYFGAWGFLVCRFIHHLPRPFVRVARSLWSANTLWHGCSVARTGGERKGQKTQSKPTTAGLGSAGVSPAVAGASRSRAKEAQATERVKCKRRMTSRPPRAEPAVERSAGVPPAVSRLSFAAPFMSRARLCGEVCRAESGRGRVDLLYL